MGIAPPPRPSTSSPRAAAATGYLCGDTFSIADLTAAATLAVFVKPEDSPMASPQPVGASFQALIARYAKHPGADWVRRIYAQASRRAHGLRWPQPGRGLSDAAEPRA